MNRTNEDQVKIVIKNEVHSFPLEVSHNESVAAVKAAYQESGKCVVGQRDYIVLLFKGKEMEDDKTLAEHHISQGSVLVHIEASHEPFRGVNYKLLAQSVKQRHLHEAKNLRMMQQENIWATDSEGKIFPVGFDKSIISTNQKNNAPSNQGGGGGGRCFYNQLSVRIGAFKFHVLPSMEGRWNGEMTSVPSQDEGTQVCSNDLHFRENEGVWNSRQMRTTISGLTTTHHFWLKPVSDGVLKVETDDHTLRNSEIILQEMGTNVLIMTATSKRSGKPVLVETITSMDGSRRCRTIQRFDESGAYRFVYVLNETRVVDAVSGAMEKYDGMY